MRLLVPLALVAGCAGDIDGTAMGDPGGGGGGSGSGSGEPAEVIVDIEGPAVLAHVQHFANVMCAATEACDVLTYSGHSPTASRAIDILASDVYGERPTDNNALGDKVAQYALDHQAEHGITYVIWRQRYNDGGGWDPMDDRGSITQNHYDHVHVSFDETP